MWLASWLLTTKRGVALSAAFMNAKVINQPRLIIAGREGFIPSSLHFRTKAVKSHPVILFPRGA